MSPFLKALFFIDDFIAGRNVARFVISGGTAFSVNLILLYIFTDFFGFWYIYSATLSFTLSLLVGFSMNKMWTFKDNLTSQIHKQLPIYFLINIFNLILNISILYLLVEEFRVWYILAQAIASILIASESFFVYKRLFHNENPL